MSPIRLFVFALFAVALALAGAASETGPAQFRSPVPFVFVAMVALVAACEWWKVEVRYRADSQTFTLGELAVVLGVAFSSPLVFFAAQAIGLGLVFALNRQSKLVRSIFNVSNATLTSAITFLGVRAWAGGIRDATAPRFWIVTLAMVVAVAPLSSILVAFARSVAERRWLLRDAPQLAFVGTANALAVGSVGVVVGLLSAKEPALAPVALMPVVLSYLALRLYVSEQRAHRNVQFLYEATNALHRTNDVDEAMADLLDATRTVFRAEMATLAIARPDGPWLRFTVGETIESARAFAPPWLPSTGATVLLTAETGQQGRLLLEDVGAQHALVRRLDGEDGAVAGLLVVADRRDSAHRFDPAESFLFDLLASQVAVILANSQLQRSLSQLTALEEELRHQANHDALTGLANRALLNAALRQTSTSERAVVLIDLDDFKTINDSLGHDVGDLVLVEVAQRLRGCVRSHDVVARLGGDEFAVLVETGDDGVEAASESASRIAAALMPPMKLRDHELVVRGSVGVATASPGEDLVDVLRNADVAMYAAKRSGKGTHRVFEDAMVADAHDRLRMVTGLRSAVARGEFSVRYQPIVELETGRYVAAEALIRWDHPEFGAVAPDRFIPIAEESGLILEVGAWMLATACREISALDTTIDLAVNVAVKQLLEPGFASILHEVLVASNFPATRLILEITERTALTDSAAVVVAIEDVRSIGVRFALDDFGTGYSSLAVVHGFPLDIVKIDKLFIRSDDLSLARSIVGLTQSLGLIAIAEGIEEPSQMEAMRAMGCELGQGFAFARPVVAPELAELLREATRTSPVVETSLQGAAAL